MSTTFRSTWAQGFSVSQPTFDSPLQFCPALGSQELDDMINAYVPGPAPIQEKRAFVSMDFFNYSHTTGESFRYYSVPALTSAGSSPTQDSGYSSSYVSPALSNWSWPQSVSASTPATSSARGSASRTKSAKKTGSSSRTSPPDFSNIPGMKIMTKDGQDVTNSASRGCKTKEQRDHAHLMRIIKACDACKKKKIRCDPSHKKRSSGATPVAQTPAPSSSRAKSSAKKTKHPAAPQAQLPLPQDFMSMDMPSLSEDFTFADFELSGMDSTAQDSWDAFVQYDDEPMHVVPDYDFFFDPAGHFSPESSMSASPTSASAPATLPQLVSASGLETVPMEQAQPAASCGPALPYMAAGANGADYVDFNLFSPASSFVDDESLPVHDIGVVPSAESQVSPRHSASPELGPQAQYVSRGGSSALGGQNVENQQFVRRRGMGERVSDSEDVHANNGAHGGSRSALEITAEHGDQTSRLVPPRTTHDHPAMSPALDMHRAVAGDSLSLAASSPSSLLQTSRPPSLPAPNWGGAGGDAAMAPAASPGSLAQNALRAVSDEISPTRASISYTVAPSRISPSQGEVSSSGAAAGGLISAQKWREYGLGRCAVRAPSTVSSVQEAAVTRAGEFSHDITAMVALGVLAIGLPVTMAASLLQLALGLMVLGTILFPKSTTLAFPEQRICGTTPLPSTNQEQRQDLVDPARSYAAGKSIRSTAHHHLCRQINNARPVTAVGRLATSRLLALTQ